jgi:hypothetical protein
MMATSAKRVHAALRNGIAVLFAAASTACNGDCAGVGRPAFSIDVIEDATGRPAAMGATLYVFRRPDYVLVDAVVGVDPQNIVAAWDQEGRFDVLLEKAGFWPWTQNNVLVETHSSCTTKTVNLTARLRLRIT